MELPPAVRIGTSGYSYPHWRGLFYPEGLPAKQELAFYMQHFDTLELNNTFYRLPTEAAVTRWASQAKPGFIYAAKGSRYLTHIRRLRETHLGVQRFFDALEPLGARLGPVLWQLPPNMKLDLPRLADFVQALPDGFPYVFEFRSEDWYCDEVYEALNDLGVSLCLQDKLLAKTPFPPPGPIYYRRFHGDRYAGRYGHRRLRPAAAEIAVLSRRGQMCFAYFNNDAGGAAIVDALALREEVADALEERPGAWELR